jgi:TonB family protein
MTENIRLYFLISLGFHLCLVLLLFLVKGPRLTEVVPRKVVVEFTQNRQQTLPPVAPEQTGLPDLQPQELAESLKMQGPRTLAMPGTKSAVDVPLLKSAGGVERFSHDTAEKPLLPEPVSPAAAPVLPAQLLAEELEGPPEAVLSEDGGRAEDVERSEDGGYTEASALEWRGRERKLLKTPGVSFPDILLEEGLEVDVVAVFTVAASGQVIQVNIVRSSGYATVDTAVQRALYSYLFEPSADASEDVARIQYRFRLERGD